MDTCNDIITEYTPPELHLNLNFDSFYLVLTLLFNRVIYKTI